MKGIAPTRARSRAWSSSLIPPIANGYKHQSLSRRGRSRQPPVAGAQHPANGAGRQAPPPDIHERADDTAHHRVQKSGPFHVELNLRASASECQLRDRPRRPVAAAPRSRERPEIMPAREARRLASHERQVQGRAHVVYVRADKRRRHQSREDAVAIPFSGGLKAGVEGVRRVLNLRDGDVSGEQLVHGTEEARARELASCPHVGDLGQRMDAGIRPAAANDTDGFL